MKVEAEIVGATSGIDFGTMEQNHMLVLRIFGELIQVPVDEETFDKVVVQAAHKGAVFEETREAMPPMRTASMREQRELPERQFTLGALHEAPNEAQEQEPEEEEVPSSDQLTDLFDEEREQADTEMLAKLRARASDNNSRLPKPIVSSAPHMPQMPSFAAMSDDDGIPQG
jgi:hypothetical protein